ncbi:MAG: hypothetical protein ACK4MV_10820 [Beijerinckiaceae bacterium]
MGAEHLGGLIQAAQMTKGQKAVCEEILAKAMRDFASEMRMVDIEHLLELVNQEKHFNLHDLVNSSAELFFLPGTLTFGWGAQVHVSWLKTPCVTIDLEFRHGQLTLFFTLHLEAYGASVDITESVFDCSIDSAAVAGDMLSRALNEALLPQSRVIRSPYYPSQKASLANLADESAARENGWSASGKHLAP